MSMSKKTIYGFFTVAALSLALSSCILDGNGSGKGNGGCSEGGRYFSFGLTFGVDESELTRADSDTYYLEKHIGMVYTFLYNSTGDLKYAWSLDITYDDDGYNGFYEGDDLYMDGYYRFVTTAKPVSDEEYKLVVFLNPPAVLQTAAAAGDIFGRNPGPTNINYVMGTDPALGGSLYRNLTALQSALTDIAPEDLGASYGVDGTGAKFFMSNATGPVPISAGELYEDEQDALDNPVGIYVERALAKIEVNWREENKPIFVYDAAGKKVGNVTDIKWKPQTVNKKTYPMRQFGFIAPYADASIAGQMETYEISKLIFEWHYDYDNHTWIYATDPNMDAANSGDFSREDSAPMLDVNRTIYHEGYPMIDESNYTYVTENTVNEGVQGINDWYKYVTHVEMSVYMTIDAFGNADAFYSYNNGSAADPDWRLFTWAQAKKWFADDSFPADMARLKTVLQAIEGDVANQVGGWRVFDFFDAVTKPEYTSADGTYYTQSLYKPTSIGSGDNRVFYHYKGVCQYRLPIKHFMGKPAESGWYEDLDGEWVYGEIPGTGYPMTTGDYGYYGVVRNNFYTIQINRVMGPGTEGNLAFISALVTINPWYVHNKELELDPYPDF